MQDDAECVQVGVSKTVRDSQWRTLRGRCVVAVMLAWH